MGLDRQMVILCPRWGTDPASGHPGAQKPPLGRGPSLPVWDDCLEALGQRFVSP